MQQKSAFISVIVISGEWKIPVIFLYIRNEEVLTMTEKNNSAIMDMNWHVMLGYIKGN